MDAKLLINGELTAASTGSVHESFNPYTGESLGSYPLATKEDVECTLNAAQKGKKTWAAMSFNDRVPILLKAADIMEKHADELAEMISREMAKPIAMARSEVSEIPALFRSCVAAGMHHVGTVFPNKSAANCLGDVAFTVTEPLGVVVCIGPFNFPLSTLTFKTAPSLTMGNAVIIKAPSEVPLTVLRYAELLNEAGFPKGVVQALSGPGSQLGEWLVDNEKINAVGFTGSTAVGAQLLRYSAPHFHRNLLELGGNDVLIITEDADIDNAAAQSMIRSANAGQICCVCKRFLVHNSIKDQYLEKLIANLKQLKIGDPLDEAVDMSCLVSESAAKSAESQIVHTIDQGAKLLLGGKREGTIIYPTVLDCTKHMDVAKDLEIFAPVWSVIGFDNDDEAIEIANSSVYGLNGGVISGSTKRGINLASRIEAGTIVANGHGLFRRDIHCFGGYKHSGMGREGISDLLNEYSQRKTIVIQL